MGFLPGKDGEVRALDYLSIKQKYFDQYQESLSAEK